MSSKGMSTVGRQRQVSPLSRHRQGSGILSGSLKGLSQERWGRRIQLLLSAASSRNPFLTWAGAGHAVCSYRVPDGSLRIRSPPFPVTRPQWVYSWLSWWDEAAGSKHIFLSRSIGILKWAVLPSIPVELWRDGRKEQEIEEPLITQEWRVHHCGARSRLG